MANQNDNGSKGVKAGCAFLILMSVLIILFTILSIMLQLVPLVAPLVFLILWLVNSYKFHKNDLPHLKNGFWLTDSQRQSFNKVANTIYYATVQKQSAEESVRDEGIHINQNGRISAKSYRGKHLRNQLEGADGVIKKYWPLYDMLSGLPQKTWKAAKKHYSHYRGFKLAFIVWAIMLFFTADGIFIGYTDYVSNIGATAGAGVSAVGELWSEDSSHSEDSLSVNVGKDESQESSEGSKLEVMNSNFNSDFGKALWKSSFWMLVVYLAMFMVCSIIFSIKYKKPPIVDVENVDTYNVRYEWKKKKKELSTRKRQNVKAEKSEPEERKNDYEEVVTAREEQPQLSKENQIFMRWADDMRNAGYSPDGNYDNWVNAGQWKNISIVTSVGDKQVRVTIEYDEKRRKVYCGIQKISGDDRVSQELLDSDNFKTIMKDTGMSVKNNEWWYCMKYVSFDDVYAQFNNIIDTIKSCNQ